MKGSAVPHKIPETKSVTILLHPQTLNYLEVVCSWQLTTHA